MQSIQQTIIFKAKANNVYDLLTDVALYAEFADEVEFENKVGGVFTVFGGYIEGENLELIPGKRIVQLWNFAEEGWDEEHYSKCTFEFNEENGITTLNFLQEEVPDHVVAALEEGWYKYYWEPMQEMLKTV